MDGNFLIVKLNTPAIYHHPDLCRNATLELAINKSLQDHFDNNKEELLAFAHTYCDLHDWDGSSLPRVTVKMTRPKWTHNGKEWTTSAIGLTSPKNSTLLSDA